MSGQSLLVIDAGDVAALAATAIEADRAPVILWHQQETDLAAPRRLIAVEHHADAFGAVRLIVSPATPEGMQDMPADPGLYEAHLLLRAVTIAQQVGCGKVVWPIHLGPDAGPVGTAVSRAALVAELAAAGAETSMPLIDLPFVDLSDEQVAELAEDAGAPMDGFWPCHADQALACGHCPGCRRWLAALETVGIGWPWAVAAPGGPPARAGGARSTAPR